MLGDIETGLDKLTRKMRLYLDIWKRSAGAVVN